MSLCHVCDNISLWFDGIILATTRARKTLNMAFHIHVTDGRKYSNEL